MKTKTQSMLEYSVVVAVIAASLVLMSIYLKRGFSGRIKQQADSLGTQYDPENINLTSTYTAFTNIKANTYLDEISIDNELRNGLVTEENTQENITQELTQTISK